MRKETESNELFEDANIESENDSNMCSPNSEYCYCNPADLPDDCYPDDPDDRSNQKITNSSNKIRAKDLAFFLEPVREEDLECLTLSSEQDVEPKGPKFNI